MRELFQCSYYIDNLVGFKFCQILGIVGILKLNQTKVELNWLNSTRNIDRFDDFSKLRMASNRNTDSISCIHVQQGNLHTHL